MKTFIKLFTASVFLLVALHFEGNAQSFRTELASLSKGADMIVSGKVIEQKSQWNSDKTRIFTQATIQVDEFLKGSNFQDRLVITYPGGEVGEIGEYYSHVATFSNDEDVLVFVKKYDRDNSFRVYQGDAGKLSLYEDRNTGEKMTSQNIKASELKKEIKNIVEKL